MIGVKGFLETLTFTITETPRSLSQTAESWGGADLRTAFQLSCSVQKAETRASAYAGYVVMV